MSLSGREALPDVRECSRGCSSCPEVMGGPLGCPGVVVRPSKKFGRPSRMSGSCQEALLDV